MHNLVADYNDGLLTEPVHKAASLDRFVRGRKPSVIDAAGWKAIDEAEIAHGGGMRPRDKFTGVAEMLEVAATAPQPPVHRRLLAGLRH